MDHDNPMTNNTDDISFNDIAQKFKSVKTYIKSKWLTILLITIAGGVLGLAYSLIKKPVYTAECSFVLEENKSGSLGQYAGLASIAGIDLSGGGNGGVFEGDNIIALYKSRTMIEKALLSNANFNGKNQSIIERYIDFNGLHDKWKHEGNTSSVTFTGNPDNFTRNQDSLITDIVNTLNKQNLNVIKPDKKLNIMDVQVASKDELFAKTFTDKLVVTVNEFYIQTKTEKATQNVAILQHQADSVRAVLNLSLGSVASSIDATPNANPGILTLRVPSQRKQVDVQASSAIYSEIVKNLEISKITLRQETPLIQIIDSPVLPLAVYKVSKLYALIVGIVIACLLSIFYLIIKKVIIA